MLKKSIKKENPLTLSELTKYHEKTLVPFLKENFVTKQEMEGLVEIVATKDDLKNFATKNESRSEISGLEKRLGEKIDNIGKAVVEIKTILSEAHVL